jgi:hypothetical protein
LIHFDVLADQGLKQLLILGCAERVHDLFPASFHFERRPVGVLRPERLQRRIDCRQSGRGSRTPLLAPYSN